jgi:hypothetical protein
VTKHSRFLHIEARRADGAPESESADRGRIAAVLGTVPAAPDAPVIEVAEEAPAGDGTPIDRAVEMPEIEGTSALTIDVLPVEGQPFVRCARCGSDNTIHTPTCDNCTVPLDTAEQRAFNDHLWGVHRLQLEKERAEIAEMEAKRAEHRRNTMRPPPELLAPMSEEDGPFLMEALRALPKKEWRRAVGASMVGVPLLLVTLGGPIVSKIGWTLVVILTIALLPRRLGRSLLDIWFGGNRRR